MCAKVSKLAGGTGIRMKKTATTKAAVATPKRSLARKRSSNLATSTTDASNINESIDDDADVTDNESNDESNEQSDDEDDSGNAESDADNSNDSVPEDFLHYRKITVFIRMLLHMS